MNFREFERDELRSEVSGRGIEDIKQSIAEKGFTEPLIVEVDTNGNSNLIEGNHRLFAAKELGVKNIPVRVVRGKNVEESRAEKKVNLGEGAFFTGGMGEKRLKTNISPSEAGIINKEN